MNFSEIHRDTRQVKLRHWCQLHRWRICHWYLRHLSKFSTGTGGEFATRWQKMGTISAYLHIKVNLKEKIYLYVYSAAQRCLNKIIKTFLIEDFRHKCQWHRWCTLSCEYVSPTEVGTRYFFHSSLSTVR